MTATIPDLEFGRATAPRTGGHRERNVALVSGVVILAALIATAVAVDLLSPYTPTETSLSRYSAPSGAHWLGTDNLGRDLFTRVCHAARASLFVSFAATVLAAILGTPVGIFAGYRGGRADQVTMRVIDTMLAVPPILLALVIRVVWGPGMAPLVAGLGLIYAPHFARVMRAPTLSLREREFVVAAEVAGRGPLSIGALHLLPNALTPLLVQFANTVSITVLLEAALSYLGQGVQPPAPSAGRMINEAQRFMETDPLLIIVPGTLVVLMTIGWNLLGDGLQRHLAPRRSQLQVALAGPGPVDEAPTHPMTRGVQG